MTALSFIVNLQLTMLYRYEELKHQLLTAQNLAEQEGDQQELARAAAAVARLTFPSSGVVDTSSRSSTLVSIVVCCCLLYVVCSQKLSKGQQIGCCWFYIYAFVILSNNVASCCRPQQKDH